MKRHVVAAILRKDLVAFGQDRFFVLLTLIGLVLYPVFFWVLPSEVDETLRLGVSPASLAEPLAPDQGAGNDAGLTVAGFDSAEELAQAVEEGEGGLVAGIVFPDDFAVATAAGEHPTVTLLVTADVAPQVQTVLSGLVAEISYALLGEPPLVDPATEAVVLGEDRVGDQVTLREQLRPLLAFFVLLVETLALAALVASEVQQRTVTAILVTPATTAEFIAAKGIAGTAVAFVEAAVIVALIGGLATQAPIILLALLLGSALVTGLGLIAGSFGRDFIVVLFVSMTFMIPLMIPAFAALFPGGAGLWVQAIPSYPLVDVIVRVTTEGAGWAAVGPGLLGLLAWCVAAFAAGVLVLRRKVVRL